MTVPATFAFLSATPGPGEILVLFAVILIVFGPRRLPEIARALGRAMDQLRRASQEFKDQIMRIDELPMSLPPSPRPAEDDPGDVDLADSVPPEDSHDEEVPENAGEDRHGYAG